MHTAVDVESVLDALDHEGFIYDQELVAVDNGFRVYAITCLELCETGSLREVVRLEPYHVEALYHYREEHGLDGSAAQNVEDVFNACGGEEYVEELVQWWQEKQETGFEQ